jgi:hypothetical protein
MVVVAGSVGQFLLVDAHPKPGVRITAKRNVANGKLKIDEIRVVDEVRIVIGSSFWSGAQSRVRHIRTEACRQSSNIRSGISVVATRIVSSIHPTVSVGQYKNCPIQDEPEARVHFQ